MKEILTLDRAKRTGWAFGRPADAFQLQERYRMNREETVAKIIESADQSRMDMFGGYPSQYLIENGRVYWADLDARKEYNAVTLGVWPIEEFIVEHSCWLDNP